MTSIKNGEYLMGPFDQNKKGLSYVVQVTGEGGGDIGEDQRFIGRTIEPLRGNPRTLTDPEVQALKSGEAVRL